jgi:hypothetical protein
MAKVSMSGIFDEACVRLELSEIFDLSQLTIHETDFRWEEPKGPVVFKQYFLACPTQTQMSMSYGKELIYEACFDAQLRSFGLDRPADNKKLPAWSDFDRKLALYSTRRGVPATRQSALGEYVLMLPAQIAVLDLVTFELSHESACAYYSKDGGGTWRPFRLEHS